MAADRVSREGRQGNRGGARTARPALLAAAALAAACVSSPEWSAAGTTWDRERTTYEQFQQDRTACQQQEDESVEACLRRRGYYPWAARNEYDRARETVPRF